jgi:hypothetical protein
VKNAHPFRREGVILAHNGVIRNHSELNFKYSRAFDVDSQHLLAHILEEKPLDELEGYGTIEFSREREPGSIFLAQMTKDGALAVVRTKYGVIWSSTKAHLLAGVMAAGLGGGLENIAFALGELLLCKSGRIYDTGEKGYKLSEASSFQPTYGAAFGSDFSDWDNHWMPRSSQNHYQPRPTPTITVRDSDECDWCGSPVMVDELTEGPMEDQLCKSCAQWNREMDPNTEVTCDG